MEENISNLVRDVLTGAGAFLYGLVKFMRSKKGTTMHHETQRECNKLKETVAPFIKKTSEDISVIKGAAIRIEKSAERIESTTSRIEGRVS